MVKEQIPILVALDVSEARVAIELAKAVEPHVGGFKVGLELLTGPGPTTIAALSELGLPVFVDAKLHDIPHTVNRAARNLGALGARWVTAHALGGTDMLAAAVSGLAEGSGGHQSGIVAISVLTSSTGADLAATGINGSPGRQVARLSRLAAEAGVEGIVCSVKELGDVAQVAPDLLKVTPGIRSAEDDRDDQARVASASEAVRRGADWLVIGRPITRADDPVAAAASLAAEVRRSAE